ncbi:unnamed protein product [Caenorhabditis bovis]|uniref:Uncharacterized protein n=1 Tax=Caenorhabditis bovis TaxID=2654633 RepID=A0A8S1E2R0_9PELO|nr:unnamed protein product [Caenorhabditis bovis]
MPTCSQVYAIFVTSAQCKKASDVVTYQEVIKSINMSSCSLPSIYTTPVKKYSIPDAEASYFYIPPCQKSFTSKKPMMIDARNLTEIDSKIDIEWVPHTTKSALMYLAVAVSFITYYAACFLKQYGNYRLRSEDGWLEQACLIRVTMIQWLVVMTLLIAGLVAYRRVLMPIYIFLAVIATNGTLVIFIVRFKSYMDGRIPIHDITLNLLGVLLFVAIVHDIVYLYAMHLHLVKKQFNFNRSQRLRKSNQYSTISTGYNFKIHEPSYFV